MKIEQTLTLIIFNKKSFWSFFMEKCNLIFLILKFLKLFSQIMNLSLD